jgi:2-octaprenyl-6-methoxyphenol hydroxylase
VRIVRDIGLGIVDRLPRLKRMFMGEAAGFGGTLPKLMRGEVI